MVPPGPGTPDRPGGSGDIRPPRPASRPPSAPAPVDVASRTRDFLQAPPKLELPKGGGAARGIGEKFQANPVTGTASLAIPLPLPEGRSGFGPKLSLSYDSGAGNGPFGMGWSLAVPMVQRKTDRGLPLYRDKSTADGPEDSDTFMLSDAEDLVPYLEEDEGQWGDRTATWTDGATTWDIRWYRPRVEGAFARIERWRRQSDGDLHWRTLSRDNVRRVYGRSASARLADPDDANRVFAWYLEEERDAVGNVTIYEYKREHPEEGADYRAGVAASAAEDVRGRAGHQCTYTYLKRVKWANAEPDDPSAGFFYELVLDHGEHEGTPPSRAESETQKWAVRSDPHSRYRAGFDVRCYRLCQRALVYHRFPTAADGDARLARSVEFEYDTSPVATTLSTVTVKGWREDGGTWTTASLPPLELTYTPAALDEDVRLVSGLDDLPQALDLRRFQWVDLDGEGVAGLLTEQGGTWYYKRNEGDGALGVVRRLDTRPSFPLSSHRLVDLDGDGRLELVRMGRPPQGYQARTADGGWEPFRSFRQVPSIDTTAPNVRMLDLDGDGSADLLVTEDEVFTWYPSEAKEGYGEARRVRKHKDEADGPTVVFSGRQECVFLADMTGDGLTDLVRVRNGNICYWPNRGYGRFGAKVQMSGTPWFDARDRFDPARVRLADLDGSGPADLVYVGPTRVRFWSNLSGNAWGEERALSRHLGTEDPASIQVADLLGDGTACLVWSSPLLRDGVAPLRYVRLMGEGKPYLLRTVDNHLGRVTTLSYAPSTTYYLEDRRAGRPWATRLPFPVQCLSKVEVRDHVTGWRFATNYTYHHGYFDGFEREFRGFGLVEQRDAESLTDYARNLDEDETENDLDHALVLPPVVTKTWFHTGAWKESGTLEARYAAESYAQDEDALSLGGCTTPAGLSAAETREAHRALKGRMLRQEVYAEDATEQEAHPYVVSASTYAVVRLQPGIGGGHAVFRVDAKERATWHYERDPSDPRVEHQVVLAVDDYGTDVLTARVSYPKRLDPAPEQSSAVVLVTEAVVVHDTAAGEASEPFHWHVGLACRQTTWHLTGLTVSEATPPTAEALKDAFEEAEALSWEEEPTTGFQKRLVADALTSYENGDGVEHRMEANGAVWPLGTRALVYQKYQLCFPDGTLDHADYLDGRVTIGELAAAGYAQPITASSDWYVRSGTQARDVDHFLVPTTFTDPFDQDTAVEWDTARLFVLQATDPVGNEFTVDIDTQVLQPEKVTDPNGNWTEATFDPLGRVLAVRLVGKDGEGDPSGTVTEPTVKYTYQLSRWGDEQKPARVKVETRETHADPATRWLTRYTYSDGGGNAIQEKATAEPVGGSPRWVATGRLVVDNKGNVVKRYEPFFSADEEFEFEDSDDLGVSATVYHDPVGRPVRVELPNGTLRKVFFTPWEQETWDENDTAGDDDCQADSELKDRAAAHVETPTTVHLDVQGRAFRTVERLVKDDGLGVGEEHPTTTLALDVQGNPEVVTDARDVDIQSQTFDALGRPVYTRSRDAGDTRAFLDAVGNPLTVWRSGDLQVVHAYDALRRRTTLTVTEGVGPARVKEVNVYGEGLAEPEALNHRGRLYQQWDTAGRAVFDAYDFKGNLLSSTRRFWADIDTEVEWSTTSETLLEAEEFTTEQTYDALNRVVTRTTPDASVTTVTYNEAGLLETVAVNVRGDATATDFVTGVSYNARGQRSRIDYGNGTFTEHAYDADTFRLTRLTTTRSSDGRVLQDLGYTYDPVGNITALANDAEDTLYFGNGAVSPDQDFTYDAWYRLVQAEGRERASLAQPTAADPAYGSLPDLATAVERYVEEYIYDAVGNILEMVHRPSLNGTPTWRRQYRYEEDEEENPKSNRLTETTISGNGGAWEPYAHDARGNIVYLPHLRFDGAQAPNVEVDFRDQMTRAIKSTDEDVLYFYDAQGQRVRKVWRKNGGPEERLYLSGYEVWRRRDTSDVLQEERQSLHVMDGESRLALVETKTVNAGTPVATPTPRLRYQLGNHLGTSALELDQDGALISYEEYHPHGATAWHAPELGVEVSAKRYRYTGKEKDEETGLYYHGARYYACWLGRWTSADPAGMVDGPNRYVYVSGRPTRMADPSGLQDADSQEKPPQQRQQPSLGRRVLGFFIGEKIVNYQPAQAQAAPGAGRAGAFAQIALNSQEADEGKDVSDAAVDPRKAFASQAEQELNKATEVLQEQVENLAVGGAAGTVGKAAGKGFLAGLRAWGGKGKTLVTDLVSWATRKFGRKGDDAAKAGVEVAKRADGVLGAGTSRGAPSVLMGKQGKHIVGHPNYQAGRSILTADPEMLAARAGTGQQVGKIPVGQAGSKERVVFDDVIGSYVDPVTGAATETRVGIVHYSADGIHIVPARPQ